MLTKQYVSVIQLYSTLVEKELTTDDVMMSDIAYLPFLFNIVT